MKFRRMAAFLLALCFICTVPVYAQEYPDGWNTVDGGLYYYKDGAPLHDQWIGSKPWRYYVGSDGRALEGLQTVEGNIYYFREFPWCNVQYGTQTVNGEALVFDEETGTLMASAPEPEHPDGWNTIDGGLYYYKDGAPLHDRWIGSKPWRYYVGSDGRALEGLQTVEGNTYYFKEFPWCNVQYGTQTVNGETLVFDEETGVLVGNVPEPAHPDGWNTIDGGLYYYRDGAALHDRWIGSKPWRYYVGSDGRALEGLQTVEGNTYYFKEFPWCNVQYGAQIVNGETLVFDEETGVLVGNAPEPAHPDGWNTIDGGLYYYRDGAPLRDRWIGSKPWRYYVGSDGRALEGLQTVEGNTYYFKEFPWCNVQYGTQTVNGQTLVFDEESGVLQEEEEPPETGAGWRNRNGGLYYYTENGHLATERWIGSGEWKYYVDETGRAVEGFKRIDGETYYFKPYPWCNVQYGWQNVHDGLYYCNPTTGALQRSQWIGAGSSRYYVDGTGRAVEGLQSIGGKTYYFKAYPDCTLQYGTQTVNGKTMHFDPNTGVLLDDLRPISPTGFLEEGIDVSEYQGSIDWKKVAASGMDYAIVRILSFRDPTGSIQASTGTKMHIDPFFEENVYNARRAGLKVGVYYYTYATDEAEVIEELTMIKNELAKIEATGFRFDYPIYVDVEANSYLNRLTKERRTYLARYALTILDQLGYYGGIYTYTNFALDALDMSQLNDFDLWIADYRSQVGYSGPYTAWQYTSTATVDGVNGKVDKNYCYKDYATVIKNGKYNHY